MRAKEFIKESPGFDAPGPSGTNYPRGYTIPNQMYPTVDRFDRSVSDFNVDPMDGNKLVHIERIDQRIAGGMSKEEAIKSYASQIAVDPMELVELYNKYSARFNIT